MERVMAENTRSHGSVDRSAFLRNMKAQLSVDAVIGNALVVHACTYQFARVAGESFKKGASHSHAEVDRISFRDVVVHRHRSPHSLPTLVPRSVYTI